MSFPYKEAVAKYRNKGWGGTLPLPQGKKESPPTRFTGKKAEYPTVEELKGWMTDRKYLNGNICLRLGLIIGTEWEVVGIDVDHYESGGKNKVGFDQLKKLEDKLGTLPETWISSARTDGKSGIRYYRVPRGLAFRGKADKDIDIISLGYRYAIVWPSIHPIGDMYWWFPPGTPLTTEGRKEWDLVIPSPMSLPLLPMGEDDE